MNINVTEHSASQIIIIVIVILAVAIMFHGLRSSGNEVKAALQSIRANLLSPAINFPKEDLNNGFVPQSKELLSAWCKRRNIDESLCETIAKLLNTNVDFVNNHCYITNKTEKLTDIAKRSLHNPTVLAITAKKSCFSGGQKLYVYIKYNKKLYSCSIP